MRIEGLKLNSEQAVGLGLISYHICVDDKKIYLSIRKVRKITLRQGNKKFIFHFKYSNKSHSSKPPRSYNLKFSNKSK